MKDDAKSHPNQRAPLAYENKTFLKGPDGSPRILAEYPEPLARFRRENIQDTVVFFGSARFRSLSSAEEALVAAIPCSAQPAPDRGSRTLSGAKRGVDMAHYYEDARSLAHLLTDWTRTSPASAIASSSPPAEVPASWRPPTAAPRGRRQDHRPQHHSALRAGAQPLHHAGAQLRVPLLLHAQALVRLPGQGAGGLSRRLRDLRRTLRDPDPGPDPASCASRSPCWCTGSEYWEKVINFQALVDAGTISAQDVALIHWADDPEGAYEFLRGDLELHHIEHGGPADKGPDLVRTRF